MSLEQNNDNSNLLSTKKLKSSKGNSPLKTNEKIIKENQNYKNEIINLNDKINELNISYQNDKILFEKKEKEIKEKYEKEIKNLKLKIENHNEEIKK